MSCVDRRLDKLSKSLRPFSEKQDVNAAVASLMRVVNQELEVLFVKRIENPSDPWSGQMAFPGGRRSIKDKNLKHTVIRETFEETGIDLLKDCRLLGVTDAVRSTTLPQIEVLPFVILLKRKYEIKLNNKELKDFFWVSLKELVRQRGTVKYSFGEFPSYNVRNNIVWGLTYSIVEKFLEALELN